ncbi:MAG: LPS export ABC transporter periplasmic protein LptC [Alphaproteobacteria bacterium]|nr:LPS export ABC transporter periplasmic protein LptC [Alphaproteobacteria bacterium]
MTDTDIAGSRRRGLDAVQRAERQGVRMSLRYSRLVFGMKVLLPALALTLTVLVVVWPELNDDPNRFRLTESTVSRSDADRLEMRKARYLGTDEDGQPYVVTAESARQDTADGDLIYLDAPTADLTTVEGDWVALTASNGIYAKDVETIDLSGGVSLFHDRGYEFFSETAFVDLAAGVTEGPNPVTGQGGFGEVTAESFRISERGDRIHFRGKTRLILYPETETP